MRRGGEDGKAAAACACMNLWFNVEGGASGFHGGAYSIVVCVFVVPTLGLHDEC